MGVNTAPPVEPRQTVESGPTDAAGPSTVPLADLDQLKGIFLASLNHEIRTPLSGILGMADLLLETNLDEEQREYVNAARLCAENLFEILNATLQYSALESGQLMLEETEFSLRETLEGTVAQHASKAQAKGLQLVTTLDAALPETTLGDAPRLREMLGYLIANAIKFTHAGRVELCVTLDHKSAGGPWIVAEVRDTGIGIAPNRLEKIFDSFHQVEGGLSRSYSGLGLGLALVRKLVSLMQGDLQVSSVAEQGSTFTVRLPLRRPSEPSPDLSPANQALNSGPVILAVEDNPVGMMVLRHSLQRHRVQVDGASTGLEAVNAAKNRRYDLILMDLQMPEMDGLTATRIIRALPGYESVPILALTANSSDDLRERCRREGMQAFLAKPIQPVELWAAVSKHLSRETAPSS